MVITIKNKCIYNESTVISEFNENVFSQVIYLFYSIIRAKIVILSTFSEFTYITELKCKNKVN